MLEDGATTDRGEPDPELEKKLAEKDRDFKRACQRYARMRSRRSR
jgi:hypothetical protein